MDATNAVAGKFPNVKFEHATGYKRDHANVATYNSKFHEGRYVQGIIAAKMSKAGVAGYIASFPIPEVVMGINAFVLGAQSVNPDFKLKVVWANTWFDPGKEADAAKALIDQGVDIITQHTDSTAPMQVAAERGIKAFGQASDMIAFGKETQLTAIVDNWGPYYTERVKAVVVSTMYDMTRVMSKGYNDTVTLEQRTQTLEQLGRQRWQDAKNGTPAYGPVSNELKGGEAQFLVDYHNYYRTPRGFHPRAVNSNGSWALTTPLSFMNMPILSYIKEISPRPILFIHGENAHSRYFSETAYAAAAQPKELMIIKGANHVDLYDRMDKIPFDAIAAFFDRSTMFWIIAPELKSLKYRVSLSPLA